VTTTTTTVYHASALTELSVTAGDDDTSALFCVGRTGNVANGGVGNVAANTNTHLTHYRNICCGVSISGIITSASEV